MAHQRFAGQDKSSEESQLSEEDIDQVIGGARGNNPSLNFTSNQKPKKTGITNPVKPFLNLAEVEGESTHKDHKGEIDF